MAEPRAHRKRKLTGAVLEIKILERCIYNFSAGGRTSPNVVVDEKAGEGKHVPKKCELAVHHTVFNLLAFECSPVILDILEHPLPIRALATGEHEHSPSPTETPPHSSSHKKAAIASARDVVGDSHESGEGVACLSSLLQVNR